MVASKICGVSMLNFQICCSLGSGESGDLPRRCACFCTGICGQLGDLPCRCVCFCTGVCITGGGSLDCLLGDLPC